MIHFIGYLLAAFGVAFTVGHSEITLGAREALDRRGIVARWVVRLMECPACLGFHLGWIYALAVGSEFHPVTLAFLTCGSNFILGRLTGLIKV